MLTHPLAQREHRPLGSTEVMTATNLPATAAPFPRAPELCVSRTGPNLCRPLAAEAAL